jgi:hypothetical protein
MPMAMDRATYTAEDVLDLLRDVETNIREGNGHFAAPVSTREAQHDTGLIPPMRDIRRPRIWLPQHASRVPIPPIANSREEWPPRYFDTFQATSTDDLTRPRVKLPQHASRISALFITDLREGLSFPTSSIDRTHVQSSRDLGAHTFPLLGDSLKGQVASANHEADNLDRPGMVHGETLSKIATCEQEEAAEVASVGAGGDRPIKSQSEAAIASAVEGRRLFIGNLAYATTEQELEDFFKDYPVYVHHAHIRFSRFETNPCFVVRPPLSPLTRAPLARSATPLLTFPPPPRPTVPFKSGTASLFSIVRFMYNSPPSRRPQTQRRNSRQKT